LRPGEGVDDDGLDLVRDNFEDLDLRKDLLFFKRRAEFEVVCEIRELRQRFLVDFFSS
jgi:hypothetical protein